MLLWFDLHLTLTVTLCVSLVMAESNQRNTGIYTDMDTAGNKDNSEQDIFVDNVDRTNYPRHRSKRVVITLGSVFMKGARAMNKLLNGATPTFKSDHLRKYEKSGGIRQMVKDFYAVKPVVNKPLADERMLVGTVGDRLVLIKMNTKTGKPTMIIAHERLNAPSAIDIIEYKM